MRFFFFIIFLLLTGITGFSQEILTGLQYNPMVMARAMEHNPKDYLKAGLDTIPVTLPFFDDFPAEKRLKIATIKIVIGTKKPAKLPLIITTPKTDNNNARV